MTPRDFCYWLQGYREIANPVTPSIASWYIIKDHLNLTLKEMGETPLQEKKESSQISPLLGTVGQSSDFNGNRPIDITC